MLLEGELSNCSYFILAIILFPLIPIIMALIPAVYILLHTCGCIEEEPASTGCPEPHECIPSICKIKDVLVRDSYRNDCFTCGITPRCLENKNCLAWLISILLMVILWLPLMLILSTFLSLLFAIFGTIWAWVVLVIFVVKVMLKVVTL